MPLNLDEPCTQRDFARLVGVSHQALTHLVRRGTLRRGAPASEWVRAYCDSLRASAAGRSGDEGVQHERQRLLRAQAERVEAENRLRSGELHESAWCEQRLSFAARGIRDKVTAVPARAVVRIRAASSEGQARQILEDELYDALLAAARLEFPNPRPEQVNGTEQVTP